MPPKRKAAAAKTKTASKKAKQEEPVVDSAPTTTKDKFEALKAEDARKVKKNFKVDQNCRLAGVAQVHEDYDCTLNQTNIGFNNNKFYIIQVLCSAGKYYAWNRWGRVGETGQNAMKGPISADAAIADFKKKFKDKTRNDWDNRASFSAKPGKYTLLLMDADETEDDAKETADKIAKLSNMDEHITTLPCKLDKPTQDLVKLIFDNDMFKEALLSYQIDVKKMPLGKLSKTQIAKGFEVLEEIEKVLNKKAAKNLVSLTSQFYTLIPHDFGRQRPPPINTLEVLRKKMDMLMVLADIELAQEMQKDKDKQPKAKDNVNELPHPLDVNFCLLKCDLTVVSSKSKQYGVLENYLKATMGYHNLTIMNIWEVDREDEGQRFSEHADIANRKLLWHGTNVAVVAAILKSGLRIMPHSGGRVGRGIYFASENGKSAGYVGTTNSRIGIMFLTEVALGKEKHIKRDDSSLTVAPSGYDSIVAKGRTEPDPKKDTSLTIEGKKVVVPQGQPIQQAEFSDSFFSQSEYLVYRESQARLRYLLKLKF